MASNRHLGRIVALQTLYELDFRMEVSEKDLDNEAVLDRNVARYSEVMEDKEFVCALVRGVLRDVSELDTFLQPLAPEWPLSQIARVDRTVLRIGLWEMKNAKDVPVRVIINEAVELAKGFGADNSSKFVNGVLGTAAKKLGLVSSDKSSTESIKADSATVSPKSNPSSKPVKSEAAKSAESAEPIKPSKMTKKTGTTESFAKETSKK